MLKSICLSFFVAAGCWVATAAAEQPLAETQGLACNVWCRHWMGLGDAEPAAAPAPAGPALDLHPGIDSFAAEPPAAGGAPTRQDASSDIDRAARPAVATVAVRPPRRPPHLREASVARSAREERIVRWSPRPAMGRPAPAGQVAALGLVPAPVETPAPAPVPTTAPPLAAPPLAAEEPAFILPTLDPLPSPPPPDVLLTAAVAAGPDRDPAPAPVVMAGPTPAASAEITVIAAATPAASRPVRSAIAMPPALDVIAALMLGTPPRP